MIKYGFVHQICIINPTQKKEKKRAMSNNVINGENKSK